MNPQYDIGLQRFIRKLDYQSAWQFAQRLADGTLEGELSAKIRIYTLCAPYYEWIVYGYAYTEQSVTCEVFWPQVADSYLRRHIT